MIRRRLREGFTTGSAAAAASAAALHLLLADTSSLPAVPAIPVIVDIPTPPGAKSPGRLRIPVDEAGREPEHEYREERAAWAAVIKDGGDDPDATHGARIEAHVVFRPVFSHEPDGPNEADGADGPGGPNDSESVRLVLDGGEGVGRVTLPGLPVPVGEAAINPGPRAQIELAVREVCAAHNARGAVTVTIRVPDGERLALRTLNARLGIVGGISILGTQGTVRPFSHAAWQRTIEQELDVALALGCRHIGLCSGRRSERLLMARFPALSAHACVQAADFIGFAVEQAASRAFEALTWGCFFGKLLKVAQGHMFTHAHAATLNLDMLAAACAEHGLDPRRAAEAGTANTAAQALDIVREDPRAPLLLAALADRARGHLERHARRAGRMPRITIRLFHLDGAELACSSGVASAPTPALTGDAP